MIHCIGYSWNYEEKCASFHDDIIQHTIFLGFCVITIIISIYIYTLLYYGAFNDKCSAP